MNLNEFKPNDIVKAMVSGCMNGTGRIMEVNENSVVFQWLEKEFACSCMHSADIFCTVTQHNIDNGDKLELMERPSADAKRLYFTETQLTLPMAKARGFSLAAAKAAEQSISGSSH